MKNYIFKTIPVLLLAISSSDLFGQDEVFKQLSQTPKNSAVNFPLDYKIARPRLEYPYWDNDFDVYYNFHTPVIKATQAAMSYTKYGVVTTVIPNSIIPHSQLDTSTMVDDPKKFIGTWRMIKFRSMRYNDSVSLATKTYYRLPDTLLNDKSDEEAFAIITGNTFKLYAKETGKTDFKKMMSAKYQIENRRYMLVYKLAKAGGGVSQIGIDENGYLVLNYPQVIEHVKNGEYFSYYAIIEQYIFERVKN